MQRRVGAVVIARLIKGRYVFIYLFQIGNATTVACFTTTHSSPRYLPVAAHGSEVSFKL